MSGWRENHYRSLWIVNGVTEEGGPPVSGGGDGGGGSGKGMQVTAAGKAHLQAKKQGSRVSLKPMDIVNKEIAEKRRRDKVSKYLKFFRDTDTYDT